MRISNHYEHLVEEQKVVRLLIKDKEQQIAELQAECKQSQDELDRAYEPIRNRLKDFQRIGMSVALKKTGFDRQRSKNLLRNMTEEVCGVDLRWVGHAIKSSESFSDSNIFFKMNPQWSGKKPEIIIVPSAILRLTDREFAQMVRKGILAAKEKELLVQELEASKRVKELEAEIKKLREHAAQERKSLR